MPAKKSAKLVCFNCGNFCPSGFVKRKGKLFCCDTCTTEYAGKKAKAKVCEFC